MPWPSRRSVVRTHRSGLRTDNIVSPRLSADRRCFGTRRDHPAPTFAQALQTSGGIDTVACEGFGHRVLEVRRQLDVPRQEEQRRERRGEGELRKQERLARARGADDGQNGCPSRDEPRPEGDRFRTSHRPFVDEQAELAQPVDRAGAPAGPSTEIGSDQATLR